MKVLILVADGFDDLTLFVPWYRLREEEVAVTIAAPLLHAVSGTHGYVVEPDAVIHEINPADFDGLLIPDGPAAERLRLREEAVDVVRTFVEDGMKVAAIGHGLQVLLSAGALDGRRVTCAPGIRDDVRAAGAIYSDEAAIIDGPLVTGRGPDDLPAFTHALMTHLGTPRKLKVKNGNAPRS
ncbi:MAG: DJ-1/PfpI/YhbO family deglycase/protease [Gemmataceae bacterium]|nr:DJ-1/PfpI/YhbO family deglycase/protease [Gemmata sp.]MDW8197255.1 DJ-1/PfpI/YhbO family deglycase/protease [Gemmataceae bacterium]